MFCFLSVLLKLNTHHKNSTFLFCIMVDFAPGTTLPPLFGQITCTSTLINKTLFNMTSTLFKTIQKSKLKCFTITSWLVCVCFCFVLSIILILKSLQVFSLHNKTKAVHAQLKKIIKVIHYVLSVITGDLNMPHNCGQLKHSQISIIIAAVWAWRSLGWVEQVG